VLTALLVIALVAFIVGGSIALSRADAGPGVPIDESAEINGGGTGDLPGL
jgi:hypothetical protein